MRNHIIGAFKAALQTEDWFAAQILLTISFEQGDDDEQIELYMQLWDETENGL